MTAKRSTVRTWLTSLALGLVVLGLMTISFAQFQINQRSEWVSHEWRLLADQSLASHVQLNLDRETSSNKNIVGQLVHVSAPSLGLNTTFASGPDLLPSDDVRVASNIKTFIAAAALKLVETGQLSLDSPIKPYLSDPVRNILQRGDRKIDHISLRHLLNHSSGIADYGSSKVFQVLAYVPTAFGFAWHWTPQDEIWFAANLTPKGEVGTHFDYSDTNYLLAADMIAKATGAANAGIALRQLLNWSALGADETYWEFYEPAPPSTRRIRQFRGAIEDTHLDVSFDQYGGGGLVMSMDDLANAHRAVVRGAVFAQPLATRTQMQIAGTAPGSHGYGFGIAPLIIAGETCWSHGGRWGTLAVYCPRLDVSVAQSWGQSNAGPNPQDPHGMMAALIRLVQVAR